MCHRRFYNLCVIWLIIIILANRIFTSSHGREIQNFFEIVPGSLFNEPATQAITFHKVKTKYDCLFDSLYTSLPYWLLIFRKCSPIYDYRTHVLVCFLFMQMDMSMIQIKGIKFVQIMTINYFACLRECIIAPQTFDKYIIFSRLKYLTFRLLIWYIYILTINKHIFPLKALWSVTNNI